ncbi:hypothetical protein DFH09DRAFT_1333614 [Mycena vulgaris]|nr:hypothetical protein DFH09DRAFT_1333614 [Mycena vulgaris]
MARPRIVGLFTAPATLSKAQFVMQMQALADALLAIPTAPNRALDAQTRTFGLQRLRRPCSSLRSTSATSSSSPMMGDVTVVKLLGGAVAEFCGEVTVFGGDVLRHIDNDKAG